MNLFTLAQTELRRSNTDRKHPFRWMHLATQGAYPEIRIVIKRHFEPPSLLRCYTDSRSPKVAQIEKQARVSALFFHPQKRLQVRIRGTAKVIRSGPAYEQVYRQLLANQHLKDYTSFLAPGSPMDSALPDQSGQAHLALIDVEMKEMEVLLLDRTQHQRSLYSKMGDTWEAQPLVP